MKTLNNHALYYMPQCPFCQKVLRNKDELGQDFELRDISMNDEYKEELIAGGGKKTVPCMQITDGEEIKWMYESGDICNYLKNL